MQVSLNWLKDYLEISRSPEEISDALTRLGLEATFQTSGISFTNVVVGKVRECSKHPNADKLSLCTVDIGDGDTHAIVCGAPNVMAGIYVPIAKIGATLQNGEFKIKETKLRGEVSHGMICSGKELQINEDHEGILILDTDAELGTPIEEVLNFSDDTVFELDLTPNRGDCLSHLGVARELGLVENKMVYRRDVKLKEGSDSAAGEIKIIIHDATACPRYAARVLKGLKVGPSPDWLTGRIQSVGLKSINNIVDAANYVLMDSGHPMHTFDLARISGNEINVRLAKKGEKFTTLDEVERNLKDFHLLICDGEKPIALAGIMGGGQFRDKRKNH